MRSINKSLLHICKGYSASSSPSLSLVTRLNNSENWFISQRYQSLEKYESEGDDAKGYSTDEMVGAEQGDENEASEMGEKAKKSRDKGMDYADRLGQETLNEKPSVERAWRAGKTTVFGDDSDKVDDDKKAYEDEVVDKERMQRLANNPGAKPIDEDDVMHVYRRSLAENKS